MAIDFPAAPANGATHSAAGAVWVYDGVKWKANSASAPGDITSVTAGTGLSGGGTSGDVALALQVPVSVANGGSGNTTAAAAPWVETAGDVMTGNLSIAPASGNAQLILRKAASGANNILTGYTGSNARWHIYLGDNANEAGSNSGSDLLIQALNDAGSSLGMPLKITRATGSATFASALVVTPKGSTFGTFGGTVGSGAVTTADANILLYNNSSANWCGMGADNNGSFWLRTGTAGSPVPALLVNPNGSCIHTGVPGVVLEAGSNAAGNVAIRIRSTVRSWDMYTQSSNGSWLLLDVSQPRVCLEITTGGVCWNQSGTWASMSDIRTKHADSIQPYTRGLADLVQLEPVMFKYNGTGGTVDDGQQMYGLVAQQVEPIVPEIINLGRGDGLKGVDSGRLMYAVLNSLREIDARLRALEIN